ncbi:hypothetical protein HPP92_004864 [Vanilla planifolia]|uniref:Uncharacterized protein n=1 Tax=Vanilla planifolia TaxID=51239 RepID=A0A835VEC5_VANPL|nr:hypothetical protein HPP92_004864 [Vanilla planifolia]
MLENYAEPSVSLCRPKRWELCWRIMPNQVSLCRPIRSLNPNPNGRRRVRVRAHVRISRLLFRRGRAPCASPCPPVCVVLVSVKFWGSGLPATFQNLRALFQCLSIIHGLRFASSFITTVASCGQEI